MGNLMDGKYRVIRDIVHELTGRCDSSSNLCHAWCCRHMVFAIDKHDYDDDRYFTLHGCVAVERDDKIIVLVPAVCSALDEKLLTCKVYGTRPAICQKYAQHSDHRFKSEYCTLRWKPLHGREAQIALSKMRKG
jgi:Fe-S-cluster containining protein